MLLSILISIAPIPSASLGAITAPVVLTHQDEGEEAAKKLEAAGTDIDKLIELAGSYKKGSKDARAVYKRILEVDKDHEAAHKALRHHSYDDQWFESYTALSAYRRAEEKRMLEEEGLVRHGDGWAKPEEVPFLRMGWEKDEYGKFFSPAVAERNAAEAKLVADGWQQQDLTWIHPDDFPKWTEGLWKCDEEWLDIEKANAFHATIPTMWAAPGKHFVVLTTLDRAGVDWAVWWSDHVYNDLVRAFGVKPAEKPEVVVLSSIAEYNIFAAGDQDQGVQPSEASGNSSVHYAFFADSRIKVSGDNFEFGGCGVASWSREDEKISGYGQHAIRHAAAHSYLEAVDPSWDTISKAVANPGGGVAAPAFWAEKKIPMWMRYGAASYVERFFNDETVDETGNPWWARDWAFQNLRAGGDIMPFEEIFAFQLDPANPEGGGALINQAGLLVSFMLDGGCKPVTDAHQAFKYALTTGGDTEAAATKLQETIAGNEKSLRRFAKL
jgi:hypothetical protein